MLFLAGEGHGNCEKVRWTRRHPPMGRRGVTEYPKRNGGSENLAAVSNRRIDRVLYDGFFSFAVVRQSLLLNYATSTRTGKRLFLLQLAGSFKEIAYTVLICNG